VIGSTTESSTGSCYRSTVQTARFDFEGGGICIGTEVTRETFESWIADDVAIMEAAVDEALVQAGVEPDAIDRVFLTGGTSLVPRIRRIFADRFGEDRIDASGELTSIAHGLALIGMEKDVATWAA
jgi:hypothetical chaperone protein